MNQQGLASQQFERSRAQNGVSMLTPPRISWRREFLSRFEALVIRILIIAAVISLATGLVYWNEFKVGFDVLGISLNSAKSETSYSLTGKK